MSVLRGFVLEGERARLRAVRAGDARAAYAILKDNRSILDWFEWPGPASLADMRQRFASWRARSEDGHDYTFAVEELGAGENEGAFAGALTMRFAGHAGLGVVGYWIDPPRWGRGLATEAVRLAGWLAFERLEAHALCARVHHGNLRSRRVLERAGWREVPACDVPDQPGCGARPQWAFRLESAARPRDFEPRRAEGLSAAGRSPARR